MEKTRPARPCHLVLVRSHLDVREDGAVRRIARKITQPAVVAAALYRELVLSALSLFSPRSDT
jgi:hypothetical protein